MRDLVEKAKLSAASLAPAFITGENGSGKEHIAHILHENSPRSADNFIAINCAALPSHLIESELFGSRRGSYTGSTEDKLGLFREAGNGTVFLDELAEMPIETQSKLLRVLQDKRVRPVGSSSFYQINCRVVAATNQVPETAIKNNKLRMDLYYRLAVITLHIPPLRQRREDIGELVNYFVKKLGDQEGKQLKVSTNLVEELSKGRWDGNVRQLQNSIHRAIIFNQTGTLTPKDFMEELLPQQCGGDEETLDIETMHKRYVIKALMQSGGQMEGAAKALGVSRGTLYEWRRKFGLTDYQDVVKV